MFDNLFSPSPSVWTGLIGGLIALPLLIHLINLMRHQKVEWAAMDFLLKSHRKNRNWVWLKQLLLLLSRIAALLLALFMLGQIGCNEDRIARLLGGQATHHYVLLDDSFSMSDQGSDGTAFDRARATLSLISARAKNRQNQKFTLLKFSKSRPTMTLDTKNSNIVPDLNGVVVDSLFSQRLEDTKSRLTISPLAVNAANAVDAITTLIKQRENESAIVYVLSDFRAKDWETPTEIESKFAEIYQAGAVIELINCVKNERPNLAITEMVASGNVRVAGTPLMMRLTIKNCSDATAEKIQIKLATMTYGLPPDVNAPDIQPEIEDLPTVFIEKIEAGKTETRDFPVFFNSKGQHAIRASLAKDAVAMDNEYWNITSFDTSARVLLIDDADQRHANFLSLAINPGGMTGIAPEIRSKDFLRDSALDQLSDFDVIYLLDVESIGESAIKNLEQFVAAGGGVGFFIGPKSNLAFYTNQLYRNGQGVFPMPLEKVTSIAELVEERIPDIAPEDHPIFPAGMKNPLLDLVQIKQIVQPPIEWVADKSEKVTIAATVRGDQTKPLIVQSRFGQGNVVVFCTTAGPVWNNWGRNGTFPPIMLLVENLLAAGKYSEQTNLVGVPIEVSALANQYGPELTFVVPGQSRGENSQLRVSMKHRMKLDPGSELYKISLGQPDPMSLSSEVNVPGIYDIRLQTTNSSFETERLALNVDSVESEMKQVNQQNLMSQLDKSKPLWVDWDEFNPEPKEQTASSISKFFLFVLLGLLLAEQILAYSASYHARKGKIREAVGGRWLRAKGQLPVGSSFTRH